MIGTSGRFDRISRAGPGSTRTLRTKAGASVVASNFGVDWAALQPINNAVSDKSTASELRTQGWDFISEIGAYCHDTTGLRWKEVLEKHESHQRGLVAEAPPGGSQRCSPEFTVRREIRTRQ